MFTPLTTEKNLIISSSVNPIKIGNIEFSEIELVDVIRRLLFLQLSSTANNKKVAAIGAYGTPVQILFREVNSPVLRQGKCEDSVNETLHDVVHAENKILLKLNNDLVDNTVLFCTSSPCMRCATNMVYKGIKALVFKDFHNNIFSTLFLMHHGVHCYQITEKDGIVGLVHLNTEKAKLIGDFSKQYLEIPEILLSKTD